MCSRRLDISLCFDLPTFHKQVASTTHLTLWKPHTDTLCILGTVVGVRCKGRVIVNSAGVASSSCSRQYQWGVSAFYPFLKLSPGAPQSSKDLGEWVFAHGRKVWRMPLNSKLFTVVTSRSESGRWVVLEEKKKTGKKPRVLTFTLKPCEDAWIKSVSHPPQASLRDFHFLFLFVLKRKPGLTRRSPLRLAAIFLTLSITYSPL